MKKQILPNRSFLTNFAMQTILLIILFVSKIIPQVIINEKEFYEDAITKAENNIRDYIKSKTEDNEIGAKAVAYYYIRDTLIPAIKAKFYLP